MENCFRQIMLLNNMGDFLKFIGMGSKHDHFEKLTINRQMT